MGADARSIVPELRELADSVSDLGAQMRRAQTQAARVPVEVEKEAPSVHVDVHVPEQAPPDISVNVNVPEQPAPIVNVEAARIVVPPAVVNFTPPPVEIPVPVAQAYAVRVVERDKEGRIVEFHLYPIQ